jgi:hypothetical protein
MKRKSLELPGRGRELGTYGTQSGQRQRKETRGTPQKDRAPRSREEKTETGEIIRGQRKELTPFSRAKFSLPYLI